MTVHTGSKDFSFDDHWSSEGRVGIIHGPRCGQEFIKEENAFARTAPSN
jgi:hypothetical protein